MRGRRGGFVFVLVGEIEETLCRYCIVTPVYTHLPMYDKPYPHTTPFLTPSPEPLNHALRNNSTSTLPSSPLFFSCIYLSTLRSLDSIRFSFPFPVPILTLATAPAPTLVNPPPLSPCRTFFLPSAVAINRSGGGGGLEDAGGSKEGRGGDAGGD